MAFFYHWPLGQTVRIQVVQILDIVDFGGTRFVYPARGENVNIFECYKFNGLNRSNLDFIETGSQDLAQNFV